MSKFMSDTGATPLNLSLTGLQLNQGRGTSSNRQSQKSLNNSHRSYLSSSTNILNESKKKPPSPASSRTNFVSDKKPKLPPYLRKEEKPREEKSVKESNIFAPTSSRSSIDEFELINKKSDFKKTNKSGLDLFFSSISNDAIDPIKDENIKKLKDSVDGLRKELKLDTFITENNEKERIDQRLKEIRKNLAAISIQKWYRDNTTKRLKHQSEIEKMFNQKKSEMKKKMELSVEKSSVFNKKQTNRPLTNQSINKLKIDESKSIKTSIKSSTDTVPKASVDKINEFLDDTLVQESVNTVKTDTEFLKNNNNSTVESLLLSLDKLDRESQVSSNKDVALASQTSEKINSILSFLDDEVSKEQANFVPKPMKDYKFDENFFNDFMKNNSESKNTKLSPPNTPKRSARRPIEKKEIQKQVKSEPKLPPKKPAESIAISKTTKKVLKSDDEEEENEPRTTPKNADYSDKVLNLEMEIEEKNRKISSLEKALNQQRELTIRHTHESERESQIRLEAQKSDYEATIKRHLSFIDQLIDDKKVLSEKCEKLVKELKESEKSYSDRIRNAEEKFKFETQKLKDTFEAAEKIRREKWIEDKTKKIKEMTVKGLEPEIQSLINKHKNEIKTLKTIHDAELLQADERAAQRYIKITEELRENFEREKEASVQRERDIAKQRYEKSLEEEEKSFLEQRRRLYAEVEEEKNRLAEQASFQRKELDRLRRMLEENNLTTIETIKKEYANTQSELEKKHQIELQNLKEKLDIEKQSWEQNYMKKQESWITQKERELKEQVRRERDKEIELLITRLESESTQARDEADRAAENRIKRIRDKYESELKEVEKTERETMERFNGMKAKFNELEGEHERLKVSFRQKVNDLDGIRKLTDTLQEERNRLADIIRQEFSDRLVFTDEENKRIKHEIAEIKSRHQYEMDKRKEEIEKIQKEKADELNTVHEKIKQVVAKKDEMFSQLKQQYEAACKRADHLEGLLEQQRTLMLKKAHANPN